MMMIHVRTAIESVLVRALFAANQTEQREYSFEINGKTMKTNKVEAEVEFESDVATRKLLFISLIRPNAIETY